MISLPSRFWQTVTVLAVAVVLFMAFTISVSRGKAKAQSQAALEAAVELQKSLDFFYSDQNRFPTAEEFLDQNIMGRYIKNFPPKEFVSKTCPESFTYKRPEIRSYQLYFCLPAGFEGYSKGWNVLAEQK